MYNKGKSLENRISVATVGKIIKKGEKSYEESNYNLYVCLHGVDIMLWQV